jgi:hypothetical protein
MSVKTYGTILEYGDTADYATAVTWTAVTLVDKIKPPKVSADRIDTTHLLSANEFKDKLPGLAEGGDLELTVQYDKTEANTLYGFFRTVKAFRLKYPDLSGWKLNGFISEYGDEEVVNGDIVRTTLTITVTNKPVFATNVTT